MAIWNCYPRGNYQILLGIVNERNWIDAMKAAEIRYGRVRQHLGPMIDRPLMVELGATQVLVIGKECMK